MYFSSLHDFCRCDKPLELSLDERRDKMCASLTGLNSSDVAYAQQAATHVKIAVGNIIVCGEIKVSVKEVDVINVNFTHNDYHSLKSRLISNPQTVLAYFVLKHSYFKSLHTSLTRLVPNTINHLIPDCLKSEQRTLPRTPYPKTEDLWLDKEYQLLALKKMMACDNSAPFLLTGPFGTGKTRVLAAAAINFLKNHNNVNRTRVLICTSHSHSADAYIDKYFGPMVANNKMPQNVTPVRLVVKDYSRYHGDYYYLFKTIHDKNEIIQSSLIVTTFLTAPQLINLKVKRFTHILIDEGAQTREPEAVAPLGLANNSTKIVIAGDHLQVLPTKPYHAV